MLPQVLDVVLVRGTNWKSSAICAAQSVRFRRRVNYSHVLVSLGIGVYYESVKGKGVQLVRERDLWSSADLRENILVLRHKAMAGYNSRESVHTILDFADKSYKKRYNPFFGIPRRLLRDESFFCSELVASVMASIDKSIFQGNPPEKIYPGHFEALANHEDWTDVTQLHRHHHDLIQKAAEPGNADQYAMIAGLTAENSFQSLTQLFELSRASAEALATYSRVLQQMDDLQKIWETPRWRQRNS